MMRQHTAHSVRPAAVAGTFYPAAAAQLAQDVDAMLGNAPEVTLRGPIKALIVPHAGYVYSGPVAATAYRALHRQRGTITRVVLLGPCHRVAVDGMALPGVDAFETPLGVVPVDAAAVQAVTGMPGVVVSARAHAPEHSLEVHLPFLQRALGVFQVLPLAVGDAAPQHIANVLEAVWGGAETLVVISSDLSHHLPYLQARTVDANTAQQVLAGSTAVTHHEACGATPLNGLMELARRKKLHVVLLDLRNSGDTAGGKDRVVGYGSFALLEN